MTDPGVCVRDTWYYIDMAYYITHYKMVAPACHALHDMSYMTMHSRQDLYNTTIYNNPNA